MTNPSSKEVALKPCPNPSCGSVKVVASNDWVNYYVYCSECFLRGPRESTEDFGADWNALPRVSADSAGAMVGNANRTRCTSCGHKFCRECHEIDECCECDTEIPPRTVAERLAQHEHIAVVSGVLGGVTPLVSRTRISVHHILSYLYNGNSIEYIAENYRLSPEAIKDAIAFAQDVYDDAIDSALHNATTSPTVPRDEAGQDELVDEVQHRMDQAVVSDCDPDG